MGFTPPEGFRAYTPTAYLHLPLLFLFPLPPPDELLLPKETHPGEKREKSRGAGSESAAGGEVIHKGAPQKKRREKRG